MEFPIESNVEFPIESNVEFPIESIEEFAMGGVIESMEAMGGGGIESMEFTIESIEFTIESMEFIIESMGGIESILAMGGSAGGGVAMGAMVRVSTELKTTGGGGGGAAAVAALEGILSNFHQKINQHTHAALLSVELGTSDSGIPNGAETGISDPMALPSRRYTGTRLGRVMSSIYMAGEREAYQPRRL